MIPSFKYTPLTLLYYISEYNKVKGVYLKDGIIYSNLQKVEKILSLDDIDHLFGVTQDVLAGILIGLLLKVDKEKIVDAIKNFHVAPHRLELVEKVNSIKYINDSKSTNIHSTQHALDKVGNKVVLLLGGEDKHLNFDVIFKSNRHKIDLVIAFGAARKKILKSAKISSFDNIKSTKTFAEAVKLACVLARQNNIVLLSPACSSFDEFSGYEERGREFVKIVKGYINAKS